MNEFFVAIFRVADAIDKPPSTEQSSKDRYIALIPQYQQIPSAWYASGTLFGLQKQMNEVRIVDWEKAEQDLAIKGFYRAFPKLSEEDQRFRNDALIHKSEY